MYWPDHPSWASTATNDQKAFGKLEMSRIVMKKYPRKLIMLEYCKNALTRLSEFSRHYNKWSKDTWQIGIELNCQDKKTQKLVILKDCWADHTNLVSTTTNDQKTLGRLAVSCFVMIKYPKRLKLQKYFLNVLARPSKFSQHCNKWSKDTWQIESEFNCQEKSPISSKC